jgi:putative peptidoglycan lipid II flippase
MLMLMVPATVGLIVLAVPIVRLLFERGAFTPADTQATALALACYAPGMIGYSVVRLGVPSFYALGTSLTPAVISAMAVGLNIVLNLALVRVMGYQGLALGSAIAALSNGALLLILLRRRLDGLEGRRIADSLARIAVAAVIMGAAVWQANLWFTALWTGTGWWKQLLIVASDIGVGLAVLGTTARLLGLAELSQARDQLLTRLTRSR